MMWRSPIICSDIVIAIGARVDLHVLQIIRLEFSLPNIPRKASAVSLKMAYHFVAKNANAVSINPDWD